MRGQKKQCFTRSFNSNTIKNSHLRHQLGGEGGGLAAGGPPVEDGEGRSQGAQCRPQGCGQGQVAEERGQDGDQRRPCGL